MSKMAEPQSTPSSYVIATYGSLKVFSNRFRKVCFGKLFRTPEIKFKELCFGLILFETTSNQFVLRFRLKYVRDFRRQHTTKEPSMLHSRASISTVEITRIVSLRPINIHLQPLRYEQRKRHKHL